MKVFVITGASDGIGAEMARQIARKHGRAAALVHGRIDVLVNNAGMSAQALFSEAKPQ